MTIYFLKQKSHLHPISVSADMKSENLMRLLLNAGYPVASSCQGDGICSKCRVKIIHGHDNLNLENELETKTKVRNQIAPIERLSCQVYVNGDITIDTDYW